MTNETASSPSEYRTTDLRPAATSSPEPEITCPCGRVQGRKHAPTCTKIVGEPPVGMSLAAWMGLTPEQRSQYWSTHTPGARENYERELDKAQGIHILDEIRAAAERTVIAPTSTLTAVDKLRLRRIMARMPYGASAHGLPLSYEMLDVDSLANWLESLAEILEAVAATEHQTRALLDGHRTMMRGARELFRALLDES